MTPRALPALSKTDDVLPSASSAAPLPRIELRSAEYPIRLISAAAWHIWGAGAAAPGIAWQPIPHKTRQKSAPAKEPAEKIVKDIRRIPRRKFSAEGKIRIVEGRGEHRGALPP
jgi:hypothetical protein